MFNRKDLIQNILKSVNLLLIASLFEIAWCYFYRPMCPGDLSRYTGFLLYLLYCCQYLMFTRIYDGFLVLSSRIHELICGQVLAAVIADSMLFIVVWIIIGYFPPVWPMIVAICLQSGISVLWSLLAHKWVFANNKPAEAVFVCDGSEADLQEIVKDYAFEKRFSLQGVLHPNDVKENPETVLSSINTVFIACSASADRNRIFDICTNLNKNTYLLPEPEDIALHGAKQVHMFHSAALRMSRNEPMIWYQLVKRLFDIFLSGTALLICSPVMLITACCIALDDGGPVFYRQKRLTKNGKVFDILKFRSMRTDAEKDGIARLSTGDADPRVTKVGHVIRRFRIDELPQFINILRGDMSIVGPRPERPELTEQYAAEIPQFRQRLRVKAGLTGYAQVYGKYNTTPQNKLMMDLVYIEHRSIWEDLQILFATVKVIFLPDATEGVSEDQVSALRKKDSERSKLPRSARTVSVKKGEIIRS